jgi:hypothetical protein
MKKTKSMTFSGVSCERHFCHRRDDIPFYSLAVFDFHALRLSYLLYYVMIIQKVCLVVSDLFYK